MSYLHRVLTGSNNLGKLGKMTQKQMRMLSYKLLVTTIELVPSTWGSYFIFECPGTFICEVDTVWGVPDGTTCWSVSGLASEEVSTGERLVLTPLVTAVYLTALLTDVYNKQDSNTSNKPLKYLIWHMLWLNLMNWKSLL